MENCDVVSLAQVLVQTPSLSGEEGGVASLVAQRMREFGFEVSIDHNGSVLGMAGPEKSDLAILFDGHLDVVPVTGKWTVDPFGGEIREGRLYGRGSTDMKGGIAAAICGVAAAAREGNLKRRVAVSASVLEEVIEGHALSAVLDSCRPQAVVICEPSKLQIKSGQKGRLEILLTLYGKPAHAASPECGINPLYDAARALLALQVLPLPRDRDLGEALLVPTDVISSPYPSISMIPSAAKIRFDRRTLPRERKEDILGSIEACLHQAEIRSFDLAITEDPVTTYTGKTAMPPRWLPAWQAASDNMLLNNAIAAVEAAGVKPSVGTWWFCTNGSESAGRRNIPTIGLGPGREEDAHTIDESVDIEQLTLARDIYRHLTLIAAT